MDLLIEKDDKRTYLSRYKVITTSFEESSPSVKRNNTQIQYRNGNVDFGGWNEAKTIDYVGYYRADDLEDEEYLRERIYALLSNPDGYYITQLKNDSDNSYERPGENTGDYFEKQVNRPSHKRFYVYASSLESELVGSYGGHVLYKISATFTTMKLPYGESVQRDLDVKPNVPYYGRNYLLNSYQAITINGDTDHYKILYYNLTPGIWTFSANAKYTRGSDTAISLKVYNASHKTQILMTSSKIVNGRIETTFNITSDDAKELLIYASHGEYWDTPGNTIEIDHYKLEQDNKATDWSPAPSDPGYNEWYLDTYYSTDNLVIPYAGTVPCNQLEQGFAVEFTAKEGGSGLKIDLNGTELTYNGQVYNGDVIELSGYEYTKNGISIVKATNKAYFKLLPGVSNKISSSIAGTIRILGYQDLYA